MCPLAAAVPLKLAPHLFGRLAAAAQHDAEVQAHMLVFLEKAVQPLQVGYSFQLSWALQLLRNYRC